MSVRGRASKDVGATETSTNDCADVIRALGDEAEEEDDLEMGEGDDDADVATDAAAPTVDPLQAQKDRDKQDKKLLEDRFFLTEI